MQLAVLGVGGAGCRLADRLAAAEPDDRPYLAAVAAFDTDVEGLERLDVEQENRHAFGTTAGSTGDAQAVREAAEANALELRRAALDAVPSTAAGVLVTVGVGGATGSGAAPILVDTLREQLEVPVYALTVLPGAEEEAVEANARAGLLGLEATVDTQLLFDNDQLGAPAERPPEPRAEAAYADANGTVAEWVGTLFSAGESTSAGTVAEQVVDASELIATFGEGGYATLGYSSQQVREKPSLLGRLLSSQSDPDSIESYSTIETTTRRALHRHRSLECDLSSAIRSLLLVTGPPAWLNREAIADARGTVAEETDRGAVRGGDAPVEDGTHLTVLLLCAGMDRPSRVAELVSDQSTA